MTAARPFGENSGDDPKPRATFALPLAFALLAAFSSLSCYQRFGDPFESMGERLAGGEYLTLKEYYLKANGVRVGIKGIVYEVDQAATAAAMDRVRANFRMALPFVIEKNYGEGGRKDKLAVVQAMDPFALVSALKTGGRADEVSTREVVKALRAVNALGKIAVTGAGRDFVQFSFESAPSDWAKAAAICAAAAPNIVRFGAGDAKKLEAEMRRINGAVLWWH